MKFLILFAMISFSFAQEQIQFHDLGGAQLHFQKLVLGKRNHSNISTHVKYLKGANINVIERDGYYIVNAEMLEDNSLKKHYETSYHVLRYDNDHNLIEDRIITISKDGLIQIEDFLDISRQVL